MSKDIRWKQRLDNFKRALKQLESAVRLAEERALTELEKQGVIQSFEYNYELAWNVIKDFYEWQGSEGNLGVQGSRDAFRLAFKRGLIENGEVWMEMIKSRQLTSHTYDEETSKKVLTDIIESYYPEYVALEKTLEHHSSV